MKIEKNSLILSVLIILSVFAMTIAIKITTDIFDSRELQKGRGAHSAEINLSNKPYKNQLVQHTFMYNGQKLDMNAYKFGTNTFVPYDYIFKNVGGRYEFFSSDDLFFFYAGNQELKLNLAQDNAIISSIDAPNDGNMAKSFRTKNTYTFFKGGHLFGTVDLLKEIIPFETRIYEDTKNMFFYHKKNLDGIPNGLKFLCLGPEELYTTDVTGKEVKKIAKVQKDSEIIYSEYFNDYYLSNKDSIQSIKTGKKFTTNSNFKITRDGKNFYSYNDLTDRIMVYDLSTKELFSFEGILKKALLTNFKNYELKFANVRSGAKELYFSDRATGEDIMLVQKQGQNVSVLLGIKLSPNSKWVLYRKGNELYQYNPNETTDVLVSNNVESFNWVTNEKFVYKLNGKSYSYNILKRTKEQIASYMKFVGNSEKGLFYQMDSKLNYWDGTNQKEIINSPIIIEKVLTCNNPDTLIIVPEKGNDAIYLVSNGNIRRISEKGKFPDFEKNLEKYLLFSPERNKMVFLESVNKFIRLKLWNIEEPDNAKQFDLDILPTEVATAQIGWINNDILYLFAGNKIMLLETDQKEPNSGIYSRQESKDSMLKGILVSPVF